jgi:hypothetical protein
MKAMLGKRVKPEVYANINLFVITDIANPFMADGKCVQFTSGVSFFFSFVFLFFFFERIEKELKDLSLKEKKDYIYIHQAGRQAGSKRS